MDSGCYSSPLHAAGLRAGQALLRSSARMDARNATTATGMLLGMETMLAGVILATHRQRNARDSLERKGCCVG